LLNDHVERGPIQDTTLYTKNEGRRQEGYGEYESLLSRPQEECGSNMEEARPIIRLVGRLST
jgi:hypothetical protein